MTDDQETRRSRHEVRRDVPGTLGTPVRRVRRWKLPISIAAVFLMVVAALAVGSLLLSGEENPPMQVEPRMVVA